MNNNFLNQETQNFSERKLDWPVIQSDMKNKFGIDIFVISLILFTQWYHDGMSSILFLLGGLLLFIASVTIAIRKFLKKPS